eukprot:6657563-Lingulodinium_polyedra.AAC.1
MHLVARTAQRARGPWHAKACADARTETRTVAAQWHALGRALRHVLKHAQERTEACTCGTLNAAGPEALAR